MIGGPHKRSKKRVKNMRSTSTLSLSEIDILVYDFTLSKVGHLKKSTINILKEKVPFLKESEEGEGLKQRCTRS